MTRRERAELIERARSQVRLAVGAIILLSLLALLALISLFLPYSPLEIHSYEATRSTMCPQELTSVRVDYTVEDTGGGAVRRVEVKPAWVAHDVPDFERGQRIETADSTPVTYPQRPGRRTVESNILRIAPAQPGEWRIAAEITVYGFAYGTPHVQVIQAQAKRSTTVLSPDGPECEAKLGGA